MKYKKVKLCVLLLGLGLTVLQAQNMYVRTNSGMQTAYSLGNIQKLTFSTGIMKVTKTTGSPDNYTLSGIRYLNFQNLTGGIAMVEKQEGAIQLYPNPVVDKLNIQLPILGSQACVIEILSFDGKVVYKEKINGQNNAYQVNVSTLRQGMYLCRLQSDNKIEIIKFIKN